MAQVRFEHLLNDNWTLGGGFQYLDGSLKGNAVEGAIYWQTAAPCSGTSTTASWNGPTVTGN